MAIRPASAASASSASVAKWWSGSREGRLQGAPRALHALPPLDPAHRVAELPRDADVVVLALRHMEDIGEPEAVAAEAAAREGEEFRIGLLAQRVVHGDAVVERTAERLFHVVERPALRVGHRDELVALAQAPQRFDGIRKGWPVADRLDEALRERRVARQAERRRDLLVDARQVVREALRLGVAAGAPVVLQEDLVIDRGAGRAAGRADVVQHAALEVDQRADHVEGQHLGLAFRHCPSPSPSGAATSLQPRRRTGCRSRRRGGRMFGAGRAGRPSPARRRTFPAGSASW